MAIYNCHYGHKWDGVENFLTAILVLSTNTQEIGEKWTKNCPKLLDVICGYTLKAGVSNTRAACGPPRVSMWPAALSKNVSYEDFY